MTYAFWSRLLNKLPHSLPSHLVAMFPHSPSHLVAMFSHFPIPSNLVTIFSLTILLIVTRVCYLPHQSQH